MQRIVYVELILDDGEGGELPSDDALCALLAHSTAAEAISEATGCVVILGLCVAQKT
jgi:hypothetical protein